MSATNRGEQGGVRNARRVWRRWGGGQERFDAWGTQFCRGEALRGLRCGVLWFVTWFGFAGDVVP